MYDIVLFVIYNAKYMQSTFVPLTARMNVNL